MNGIYASYQTIRSHSDILPHGCIRVFRVLLVSIFLPTDRPMDLKYNIQACFLKFQT